MRIIAGLILQLIFISSFCQPDCVIMNKCNKLAYNKDDTTKLYNGDCKQFDNKGRIKSHGYFINGKLIYAKNWTKDGNLIDSIHYTNYFDNSYEIYVWWDNGNLKTSQFYKNDTIIDTCTFYFQNGLVDNEQIFNKGKILKQTYYFDNGKPKRIVNYKDDQIVNPVYEWDKFGNKYEVIEKVNGQYKFLGAILWTSDIISKTIISNDSSKTARLDDSIIKCDDGLVFKTCITYKNNKEHGLWERHYKSGEIKERRYYNNGEPTGHWMIWDKKGYLMVETNFDSDLIIEKTYIYNFKKNTKEITVKSAKKKGDGYKVIKTELITEKL